MQKSNYLVIDISNEEILMNTNDLNEAKDYLYQYVSSNIETYCDLIITQTIGYLDDPKFEYVEYKAN
jgi:hypothetical protein